MNRITYCIYRSAPLGEIRMETVAKVFSTIRRLRRIRRSSCRQQRFLYPLLFQDDLYGIAYNRFMRGSNHRRKEIYGSGDGFNFLTLKRLMRESRQSNFSWIAFDRSIDKLRIAQEILVIVSNLTSPPRSEPYAKKMNEWSSYQSIHSVFPFMEDSIRNSNSYLDVAIPYRLHPENSIRIFRRRIPDTSFLHLLRLSLHRGDNLIVPNPPSICSRKQLHCFMWNQHTHEFECSLIRIWKQNYRFRSTSFRSSLDRRNLVRKIKYISEQPDPETAENTVGKNQLIHYARYRNNLIMATDVGTESLIENWKLLLTISWERCFHSWFEPCRVSVKNLSKNPLPLLGYILRTRSKIIMVRIRLVNHSIDTDLVTKEFCSIIPIVSLIGLLAKEGFCDSSGRPTCRSSWAALADNEILRRFDRMTKSISCYYDGCFRRKGLYQLQYIFRFSCAKTLACRHKSTIRAVWKRYGSNSVGNFVYLDKTNSVPSNSWRVNPHGRKFWYMGIIQINYLADSLRKSKNA